MTDGGFMNTYLASALEAVDSGKLVFCKFLSANDTGDTGSHQVGIYIAKNSIEILFDKAGVRGSNKDKMVKIRWQNDFETDSRFIYYGTGTRNEYRITRFGRGFPFLSNDNTGDLFILVKEAEEYYSGYFLQTDDDIEEFLGALGMGPSDTGTLINKENIRTPLKKIAENDEKDLDEEIECFINSLEVDFPPSVIMSKASRMIHTDVFNHIEDVYLNPDKKILSWLDTEYTLFKAIEKVRYGSLLQRGFTDVDELISIANSILNRRKSRAGKSLEHHLSAIFDGNGLHYSSQGVTEGNRKPDFIFPSIESYHSKTFPKDRLIFLGAKTTCKDRWRQIINEASKIETKYLFTLQQGISSRQLDEMKEEKVKLVVPREYLNTFPKEGRDSIMTLKRFIDMCKDKTI